MCYTCRIVIEGVARGLEILVCWFGMLVHKTGSDLTSVDSEVQHVVKLLLLCFAARQIVPRPSHWLCADCTAFLCNVVVLTVLFHYVTLESIISYCTNRITRPLILALYAPVKFSDALFTTLVLDVYY